MVPTTIGIAEDPSRREDWKQQYSMAAVRAYLAGDGITAADALNKAGGELQAPARDLLYKHTGDLDKMKKEIALLQSPSGKDFQEAEALYDQGHLDGAIATFAKCEGVLKDVSDPLSSVARESGAQALRSGKDLAGGDWTRFR